MSDFSGMATVYNVLCNDGRTIKPGAFDHQDGQVVPLVWRHSHDKITNVIGHGTLSVSQDPPGMRITGTFNTTKEGRQAKQLVDSRDVTNLSIWANEILEHSVYGSKREVEGGTIREVSLVLSGANPGAKIDDVIRHSADPFDLDNVIFDGVIIHTGIDIEVDEAETEEETEEPTTPIQHTDETIRDVLQTLNPDQERLFDYFLVKGGTGEDPVADSEGEDENAPSISDVFETLSHEQKTTLYYLVGSILPDEEPEEEPEEEPVQHAEETVQDVVDSLDDDQAAFFELVMSHAAAGTTAKPSTKINNRSVEDVFNSLSEKQARALVYLLSDDGAEPEEQIQQGDLTMTRNIFEANDASPNADNTLSHEAVQNVILTAAQRKATSLRELFEQADIEIAHSVTNIDYMFPDAAPVTPGGPEFFSRPMEWVEKVLGATKNRPFSRIKSWYSDLTPDAARAKGYVTGDQKAEEVVAVMKRTTTPQTIYKLQKLDRDDVLDITDFDIIVWLKTEMRLMLREELARAILIGDGRLVSDDYKIQETNIRSILNDDAVYTITHWYNDVGNEQALSAFTDAELIDLIDDIALSMIQYRGSGSPTFYCQPEVLTRFLLVRDTQGRRLHANVQDLAASLRVSNVMEIPVMADLATTGAVDPTGLPAGTYNISHLGIIVNLADYVIGLDRGGQTTFFDDFDLNFNKHEYLYETRLSGALIHPKSAIAVNLVTAKTA